MHIFSCLRLSFGVALIPNDKISSCSLSLYSYIWCSWFFTHTRYRCHSHIYHTSTHIPIHICLFVHETLLYVTCYFGSLYAVFLLVSMKRCEWIRTVMCVAIHTYMTLTYSCIWLLSVASWFVCCPCCRWVSTHGHCTCFVCLRQICLYEMTCLMLSKLMKWLVLNYRLRMN